MSKTAGKVGQRLGSGLFGLGAGALGAATVCTPADALFFGLATVTCAITIGIGTALATDWGVTKLSELWNRDEFEEDLHQVIASHREEVTKYLESRMLVLAHNLQSEAAQVEAR